VQDMRRDPSAAETPLIHVDQPTTVDDDMKPIRIDIEDVGAAPLRVVGGISPVVLVTIEVAPLSHPSDTMPDFLSMIADKESVGVAIPATATATAIVVVGGGGGGVIYVSAAVVDTLTIASSRIPIP
jgi:hypothetical protein